MAENTLDIHFTFGSVEQKEAFKTALQGFVKEQQQAAAAGLSAGGGEGGERLGYEPSGPQPAGISIYVNFIPKW